MLVLSRKQSERVIIRGRGVRVIVQVVDIDRGKIRLGFEAPNDIQVDREEIAIEKDKARAAEQAKRQQL